MFLFLRTSRRLEKGGVGAQRHVSSPGTSQSHQCRGSVFPLPVRGEDLPLMLACLLGAIFQPGAQQALQAIEAVGGLLAEAEGLAVSETGQQHLCRDAAERRIAARLRLQQGKDQQQTHAGGEGGLLGLLEQTLSFQQGQGLLVGSPGSLPLLLLLQGQLALRPPQASQSIETVLQQAGVRVALISTDGTQTLGELHGVLRLKCENLLEENTRDNLNAARQTVAG